MATIYTLSTQKNGITDVRVNLQEVRNRKGVVTSWLVNVSHKGFEIIDRRIKHKKVAQDLYNKYRAAVWDGWKP